MNKREKRDYRYQIENKKTKNVKKYSISKNTMKKCSEAKGRARMISPKNGCHKFWIKETFGIKIKKRGRNIFSIEKMVKNENE